MFIVRETICVLIGVFIILAAGSAYADIYRYRDENGAWHFTNINSDTRYKLYIRTFPEKPSVFIEKYGSIIEQASQEFNLESSLIKAVIKAESDFDEQATSEKGAQGLMQLMPKTANEMAVDDPYNPEKNIFGGAQYLSSLIGRYNNDLELALAAYNAGPENVDTYNGVPPYPETENFIQKVLNYYKEYKSEDK